MTMKMFLFGTVFSLNIIVSNGVMASSKFVTEQFSFLTSKEERLYGIISRPENIKPKSIVIIVHGYGQTNVVKGFQYQKLRSKFTSQGVSVVVWDKPGCGESEGEFDINQPVESSAKEILAAIRKLKQRREPGVEKIGLWGVSRAGWIAPLAISQESSIKFWISVSGTDAHENWGYLLRSSLKIAGYSSAKIDAIHQSWINKNTLFWSGADYESYLKAGKEYWQDEIIQKLSGQIYVENEPGSSEYESGRKLYYQNQKKWLSNDNSFNTELGLEIHVPEFEKILKSVSIPVLAIFGDNDRNVDWKKTKSLYENTIGVNNNSKLTIKVFENADHNLRLSKTGGYLETQQNDYVKYPIVDGYYDVMVQWLCTNDFCSNTL